VARVKGHPFQLLLAESKVAAVPEPVATKQASNPPTLEFHPLIELNLFQKQRQIPHKFQGVPIYE